MKIMNDYDIILWVKWLNFEVMLSLKSAEIGC